MGKTVIGYDERPKKKSNVHKPKSNFQILYLWACFMQSPKSIFINVLLELLLLEMIYVLIERDANEQKKPQGSISWQWIKIILLTLSDQG